MIGSAYFFGPYRYKLTRIWDEGSGWVTWVMLNPSTADATTDDPTIRRCVGFSQSWGYRALTVVNLFAFVATDPRQLLSTDDPVGPYNREYVSGALAGSDLAIVAWGSNVARIPQAENEVDAVVEDARDYDLDLFSLGTTKAGHPRHPLYLAAATEGRPWPKVAA